MQKEIPFVGLSAIPDDYQAPDGHLDIAYNLIPEDGHLSPLLQPRTICTLPSECDIVFIHRTAAYEHYIIRNGNSLYWIDKAAATGTVMLSADNLLHSFPADDNTSGGNGDEVVKPADGATTIDTDSSTAPAVTILSFNAVGNTLIISCSDGMHYFLWKLQNDGYGYAYLGNHIPELPLSFGLQGEKKIGTEFLVDVNPDSLGYESHIDNAFTCIIDPLTSNNPDACKKIIKSMTDTVLAKAIAFIAENGTNEGKFVMPFFVRYAFRLYDGSLVMHSAPVLMLTDSGTAPHVPIHGNTTFTFNDYTHIKNMKAKVGALFFDLDYCCVDSDALSLLGDWDDVVKSVDIFVSAPLYRFDQSGEVRGFTTVPAENLTGYTISKTDATHYDKKHVIPLIYDANEYGYREFALPTKSDEAFYTDIKDACNYYLLKSINIKDIATTRTKIDFPKEYLASLQTREAMSDDYDSHDTLIPNFLYTYNQRLNIAGINKLLAPPMRPETYIPFCETNNVDVLSGVTPPNGLVLRHVSYQLFVFVKTDDGIFIVKSTESASLAILAPFLSFYYPNTNAYKAVLKMALKFSPSAQPTLIAATQYQYYLLPLSPHNFLNGAVFFDTFSTSLQQLSADSTEVKMITADPLPQALVALPNKIYTSEVNNPFLFPVTGINTVGTGTILGISSAARPMSTGQFGQFPLYAFCSDGIWALQVSATGGYSAVQPIARDVCSDTNSITQLDSSVLFATSRGIMQIAGSTVQSISDAIDNPYPLGKDMLPRLDDLYNGLPIIKSFGQFLVGARLLYDYLHQRIILFNPSRERTQTGTKFVTEIIGFNKLTGVPISVMKQVPIYTEGNYLYRYAYVLSLKSNQWGMMATSLKASLNSYPDALAVTRDNHLVSFDTTDNNSASCLAVSRPLKLDAPDTLKTVRDLIQRGIFDNGDVKTALYGSRDLHHWHLIATSANHKLRSLLGTPYKYFRLVTLAPTLSPDKSIAGASVVYLPKQTNRLR